MNQHSLELQDTMSSPSPDYSQALPTPNWHVAAKEMPTEPGSYIAVLREDNRLDWDGEPHEVSFGFYIDKPNAFHAFDRWEMIDITDDVVFWMKMPKAPTR